MIDFNDHNYLLPHIIMQSRKRSYDWRYSSLSMGNPAASRARANFRWIMMFFMLILLFVCTITVLTFGQDQQSSQSLCSNLNSVPTSASEASYNSTYPLSPVLISKTSVRYKIALIADLDKNSKSYGKDMLVSFIKEGYVDYQPSTKRLSVTFEKQKIMLKGIFTAKKRGMELSELTVFNGKLYTCDDRTGIVYELRRKQHNKHASEASSNYTSIDNQNDTEFDLFPWVILMDGDGINLKPFKCEWLAVKDKHLYAGSLGKPWTTVDGIYVNNHPQWVKRINMFGAVEHLNWCNNYQKLAQSVHIKPPGYVIHESAAWSNQNKKWYFLPRKASNQSYNEDDDESQSSNLLIVANEDFSDIVYKFVGNLNPLHGFSSFKFVPNTNDEIILAIKSMEYKNQISTFIMAFDTNGSVLLDEQLVDDSIKFEGIEFI